MGDGHARQPDWRLRLFIQSTFAARELDVRYFDDAKYAPQTPQIYLPLRRLGTRSRQCRPSKR